MANLSKLKNKKKNRFGSPPTAADTADNLSAPETAPTPVIKEAVPGKAEKVTRPARKTGRTEPFGTRVSPEFLKKFKRLAFEDELKFVELLEKSLDAYERQRQD